ncbi:MAG: RNA polymerase factor sigma-54 [Deltaproteobacteria bacterium]|nr:RNA polymerase factor sigma-54 [Deltaproteobacteria bacterium]MBW2253681.1 RNA polymerase factor sigma-54 [Deltaproteobacteria bacterium]
MALDLRLDQRMTQSLVMTPRLQQAIKLLQYNHMEMVSHVQEQLLENPTLEMVPDTDGGVSDGERKLQDQATLAREKADEQQEGSNTDQGIDWEGYLQQMAEGGHRPTRSLGGTIHEELPPIETNLTYGESLADHLVFQVQMLRMGEEEERGAHAIIHNLDHRGYLTCSLEEIAESEGVSLEIAQDSLEIVQGLDPLGCGARDLSECLILQAKQSFPEDDNFPKILADHLHDLERRNYPAIARALDLELEDVIEYHKMIQDLEPHPGRGYSSEEPRYITPDLYLDKHGGEWQVRLNEDGMPDLRVSRYYQRIFQNASKEDREYLLDKLRGAEFLIKSINKRRRTIVRVMESILKFQRDFFDKGPEVLRPMVLQDVADDVGVHMSTVSRVTTNKYVHTPHGIFELKYFFSAAVKQDSGGDMAAIAIKTRIRTILQGEDARKPLSDQAIANLLKKEDVRIARRTVAKYRESMGILPSSQRKQMF